MKEVYEVKTELTSYFVIAEHYEEAESIFNSYHLAGTILSIKRHDLDLLLLAKKKNV